MKKMIQATLRLKPQVHRKSNIRNICQMMYLEITMITITMTIIQVRIESNAIFQITIVSQHMEFPKKSRLAGKYATLPFATRRLVTQRLATWRLATRRLATRRLATRRLSTWRLATQRFATRTLATRTLATQ